MKVGAGRARHAVPRPGRHVVRINREVIPRVDVEVLRCHHVVVAVGFGQPCIDGEDDSAGAGHGQRPSLTEIVLHVDDH